MLQTGGLQINSMFDDGRLLNMLTANNFCEEIRVCKLYGTYRTLKSLFALFEFELVATTCIIYYNTIQLYSSHGLRERNLKMAPQLGAYFVS